MLMRGKSSSNQELRKEIKISLDNVGCKLNNLVELFFL
jgi:hypothetical protein